ncbi:MAG: hypothetical protein A2428_10425 [Bdellovibrionales bacterium RIFOXYC1_FULL_54_43]|nr:MAG: hypothetical protein A2428_10425 [Bdellovibrionales bacterium RIFOXYC1_FULL_54_43]OFZ80400.1 MAG: hypothetical protein A2603_13550 [Bdellovibrionales bacterium RIFOXYD1_FULL_55_31]
MLKFLRFLPVVVLASLVFSPNSRTDEIYTFVVKKQEEKAKNRWTLAEWLETRDRMRLMDLWLALHSPTPYEFVFEGAYESGERVGAVPLKGTRLGATAYASIFGLGVSRTSVNATDVRDVDLLGTFFLRIFGFHAQGTNITLQAGVRGFQNNTFDSRNAFAGVASSIYLNRFFGIEGLYRHHFDSLPGASGSILSGARHEGGAFIDFRFFRVFGNYFSDSDKLVVSGIAAESRRTGINLGTKLFF